MIQGWLDVRCDICKRPDKIVFMGPQPALKTLFDIPVQAIDGWLIITPPTDRLRVVCPQCREAHIQPMQLEVNEVVRKLLVLVGHWGPHEHR